MHARNSQLKGYAVQGLGLLQQVLCAQPCWSLSVLIGQQSVAKCNKYFHVIVNNTSCDGSRTTHVECPTGDNAVSQNEHEKKTRRSEKEPLSQKSRFIDRRVVEVRAGSGGDGCVAYMAAGGKKRKAAGGHGGPGGSIILQASKNLLGLERVQQLLVAAVGGAGGPNGRQGARGPDRLVLVPMGTVVKQLRDLAAEADAALVHEVQFDEDEDEGEDEDEDEGVDEERTRGKEPIRVAALPQTRGPVIPTDPLTTHSFSIAGEASTISAAQQGDADLQDSQVEAVEVEGEVLAELLQDGQQLLVAQGGRGGMGNTAFDSKPWGPPSEQRSLGRPGQRLLLRLESRLIADVGLLGFPNAGKSTLLAAISAARAKLGAVWFDDGRRLILADFPGLVEGAHANRGRGNEFLRHVERTRCLVYVVDLSGGPGGLVSLGPEQQLAALQHELQLYQPGLLQLPSLVVANKADSMVEPMEAMQRLMDSTTLPVILLSAMKHIGLEQLKQVLRLFVPEEQAAPAQLAPAETWDPAA